MFFVAPEFYSLVGSRVRVSFHDCLKVLAIKLDIGLSSFGVKATLHFKLNVTQQVHTEMIHISVILLHIIKSS